MHRVPRAPARFNEIHELERPVRREPSLEKAPVGDNRLQHCTRGMVQYRAKSNICISNDKITGDESRPESGYTSEARDHVDLLFLRRRAEMKTTWVSKAAITYSAHSICRWLLLCKTWIK